MTLGCSDVGAAPEALTALCRDCFTWQLPHGAGICDACGSPRLAHHPEIRGLSIAHIDCDAFYASVEKRDDPSIADKPLIVGGGRRGVVSTCCYIARLYGVHSAMPMYKALKACPDAVVLRPDMAKYAAVGREVRRLMTEVTPLIEPLSIDEAFLDLGGTERLHHAPPAETLARLLARISGQIAITASVGLSYNKFLAKIASDLDKPRGFSVIGKTEASSFLAGLPVTAIWGVGQSFHAKLRKDGLETIGDLQVRPEQDLVLRYGSIGTRLARFSHGQDDRNVTPESETKSISSETTFDIDMGDLESLRPILWRLCDLVSTRLKAGHIAGRVVTIKLKMPDFRQRTRRTSLNAPTQLADTLFRTALPLLERELGNHRFRLLGVSVSELADDVAADPPDLADPDAVKRKQVEHVVDELREKLGRGSIEKGRGFGHPIRQQSPPSRPKIDDN